MKKMLVVILLYLFILSLTAYTVGQYSKTFTDPARGNRPIETWIYYPIDAGNPQEIFPYIIYGHGWNGDCTYYSSVTNAVVNQGWIIAYPRTEEEIFGYDTEDLAMDMAFLKQAVYLETLDFTSPLYTKIDTLAIVGGYSMGGAYAVAAVTMEPTFASLVTLAAAPRTWLNLYPATISMATSVTIPSLTYSGSDDNTAPPDENQIPIYNNLASIYKSFVSFTNQGHISFYDNPLIYVILEPWLQFIKTNSGFYIDEFESVLASYPASTLTYQIVDNLIIIPSIPENVSVSTENDSLTVSWDNVLDAHGYFVYSSDNPHTGFTDVTNQGVFTNGSRISWNTTLTGAEQRYFYIKSYR